MNRGEFCHQWWQELSRILSSYSRKFRIEEA